MIYFDSASTALQRPPTVAQAVAAALSSFGGAGRGAHQASLNAERTVFTARTQLAQLLGASSPKQVAFSSNATEALNTVIAGLLNPGDHAITTAASHNSVLRPLYQQQKNGVELSILPVQPSGAIDFKAFEALFKPPTRLAVLTHASNLTGDVYDITKLAAICHAHGALIAVDAAQTAGVIPIDLASMDLDVLVFTGHKGMLGPQGTGGLCLKEGITLQPLKVGGSGSHSFDQQHPTEMPERLEAGTLNSHGLAGLSAGLDYLLTQGIEHLASRVKELTERFESQLRGIDGIRTYGGQGGIDRCGIVAVNIGNVASSVIADRLSADYGICVRAKAHCAPLMHEALGTATQGAVRFSFSSFNTVEEVDVAIRALAEIAKEVQGA